MCDIEMTDEHEKEGKSKEHQLKHILSENMRMLDDSKESDKFGPYLEVSSDDDDMLHSQEHTKFISSNKLSTQMKSKMQNHIKKHDVQYKEKERMGLVTATEAKEEEPKVVKAKVRYMNEY